MPNNKVLVISGPTATGKTALAVEISKLFPAEIISADSRQVYIGMDIGVGKDHPAGTPIHGIDLITPKERYSVSQFQRYALQKIKEIHSRGHLPIVVGCTGFYINSILKNNYATFHIKPNNFLRFFLDRFPLKVLQFYLKLIDFPTYSSLNISDVRNPRRLIRKIEIKLSSKQVAPVLSKKGDGGRLSFLHLSLTAPNSFLYPRIDTRVQARLDTGLLEEIKNLLKVYSWNDPGLKSIAYYEFKDYFKSNISLTGIQSKWANDEHSLARRQKTYFKIIPAAHFIDISKPNYQIKAINFVKKFLSPSCQRGGRGRLK